MYDDFNPTFSLTLAFSAEGSYRVFIPNTPKLESNDEFGKVLLLVSSPISNDDHSIVPSTIGDILLVLNDHLGDFPILIRDREV